MLSRRINSQKLFLVVYFGNMQKHCSLKINDWMECAMFGKPKGFIQRFISMPSRHDELIFWNVVKLDLLNICRID